MKTLYIIRGLPGTGKSTLAKQLVGTNNYFEADMFFMENGNYKFDAELLKEAHEWCQRRVEINMELGLTPIAVSNTFTQHWEMRPYELLAKQYGYTVIELTMSGEPFPDIHCTPKETIERMRARWEL